MLFPLVHIPSANSSFCAAAPLSSSFGIDIDLVVMGLMIKKPEHVAGSAAPAIIVGLFVAFGGILYGYVEVTKAPPA